MKTKEELNGGSIQVHKKVLREIIYSAASEVDGVVLYKNSFLNKILRLIGIGKYSSIKIRVNNKQEVSIEVKIFIRYGLNITNVAKNVQDAIKGMIEKSVEINLKNVDVNIQGIERGV